MWAPDEPRGPNNRMMKKNRRILFERQEHITPRHDWHYNHHSFEVPPNASKVGVRLTFVKEIDRVQLYISLHDPKGFRGHQQCPGPAGEYILDLWVCPDDAVNGALPGALPCGTWWAQIDFDRCLVEADYHVVAYVECERPAAASFMAYPDNHVVKHESGWYQGELHAHSSESDALCPVETVVQSALDAGLDFLALTDHFTNSHWRKLIPLLHSPLALIRSCEITAHLGHANLHGIQEWVDVYVDRPDWTMNHAARAVHKQGGLFCVNHAFSGYMAWRYFDFDWRLADLLEVYDQLEGCNTDRQLSLWDHLLNSGLRIVGVAGTDSHNLFYGNHRLGQSVTWVFADELSEKGIIAGLQRGQVYVSQGAQLRFSASCENGDTAGMWESLSQCGLPVTLHIEVFSDEPLRVFIIKNGFLLSHHYTLPGHAEHWQSIRITDTPNQPSFYRIELHKDTGKSGHADYPDIYWRDFSTMRALSNPIWVAKTFSIYNTESPPEKKT